MLFNSSRVPWFRSTIRSGNCKKEEVEVGTNSSTVTLGGTLALMWCDHKTWLIQAHYADTTAAFVRGKNCPS